MPLLDHFHPPLKGRRHWHSFHNGWAARIAADLNQKLPHGWFAEPNVLFGIEIDAAIFEDPAHQPAGSDAIPLSETIGGWKPAAASASIPFEPTTEIVEVSIFNDQAGPILVGAIELISPANKDRPVSRETFISKCETYLRESIGLVLVDVVTQLQANLHNQLLARLDSSFPAAVEATLYTSSYRALMRGGRTELDIWQEPLELSRPLPVMPLWLRNDLCLSVDLNSTYEQTCLEQRIIPDIFEPPVRRAG